MEVGMTIKKSLHDLVLASLVQSGMRLVSPGYEWYWDWTKDCLAEGVWRIAPT